MSFAFTERTTYDKVEDSILALCKEAIEEGNVPFLQRGLPTIAIAEELDPILDLDGEEVSEQLAISTFDDTDENMFIPKVVQLNEELLANLDDEDMLNALKRLLRYDERYVTKTSMEAVELVLSDKDGDPLEPMTVTTEAYTLGEDEEEETTAATTTIDLEAISAAIKAIMDELVESEEEEEKETTARIDKYKMSVEEPKTKTIVSKENRRYKGPDLLDNEYESMIEQVAEVQDILDSAIESSGMSKMPSETPDKRLAIRNVVIGHHKEYLSNKMMYGKKLNVVVASDRSGSMHGAPARDSAILITALNNLAHIYKELTVSILFSDDSEYALMDFPVGTKNDKDLLSFTNTHGAEGLAENMDKELERLEKADCVFVYTDGDICSGNVDKPSYTAKGIELTGLYTATSGSKTRKLSVEDYNRHYNKNKAWFHNVIVSTKPTDLAEHMVDYMIG